MGTPYFGADLRMARLSALCFPVVRDSDIGCGGSSGNGGKWRCDGGMFVL